MLVVKRVVVFDDLMRQITYGLKLANTVTFNFKGTFGSDRDPIIDHYNLIFGAVCHQNELGDRKISIFISEEKF
jgi:hypothetical protein